MSGLGARRPPTTETPRVPLIVDGEVAEFDLLTAPLRENGRPVPNLMRVMGRSPEFLRGWGAFSDAVRFGISLPRGESELVILRVSLLAGCRYSFAHHVPMALEHGVTEEQLAALPDWSTVDRFSGRERALLAAADAVVGGYDIGDEAFAALAAHLPAEGVLEVVALASFYLSLACVANSAGVPVDERVAPGLARWWRDVPAR
ncbi:carboxymuconolactone decarboxylase family protein [Phytohabitans sp. ZYX-F-186]|uniref:Carboxymuconolactone decarboxylase family protein n=1 Tax=Phytohabitans maris TaxID=3071409 RepID=A0ABU0ZBP3_9ACTN|nr:carboxymuconolactone decarboxylase family protein [Phytohabitans sp. ZYX-F-186]MDQ7903737.1 carboxymuconolactone decarboxylase family protein [Phytohabitans sp. ZYX-F-186]